MWKKIQIICNTYHLTHFYGFPILLFSASAFEPDFVFPLENVTIAQGRDATFTCVVNNLGGYRVSSESNMARVCIFFSIYKCCNW